MSLTAEPVRTPLVVRSVQLRTMLKAKPMCVADIAAHLQVGNETVRCWLADLQAHGGHVRPVGAKVTGRAGSSPLLWSWVGE